MKSQMDVDTDCEYFDDPIKLFDLEHDRVLGTHTLPNDIIHTDALDQSIIGAEQTDAELPEFPGDVLEDSFDGKYLPVSVKLVDCAKFPWYFKKYTAQLINKEIDFYDLVSDSDSEMDISNLNDINDINLVSDNSIQISQPDSLNIAISKAAVAKRQETMKRREDFELQLALSRKSLDILDYKRNKGLIGMTIKQKNVKDVGLGVKIYHPVKEKIGYTKIAGKIYNKNKTLSAGKNINSKVIVRIDKNSHAISRNIEVNDVDKCRVKATKGELSEKLLYHMLTTKTFNSNQEDNKTTKSIDKQKPPQYKTKRLDHAINIMKTNKYKKQQIKDKEDMHSKMDYTQSNIVHVNINAVNSNENSKPHASILPCSTLKKNTDSTHKTVISAPRNLNETEEHDCIASMIKKAYNQIIKRHSISTLNVKPHLVTDTQTKIHKHVPDLTGNTMSNKETLIDQSNKNGDSTNNILFSNSNDTGDMAPVSQNESNNMQVKIVSVTSLTKSVNSNNNIDVVTVDTTPPPLITESSQSNRVSVISNSNRTLPQMNHSESNPILCHALYNNNTASNTASHNIYVHNAHASPIILKPNQPNNFQGVRFSQPLYKGQNCPRMLPPAQTQSRLPLNSYQGNYHSPPHSNAIPKFTPRFVNSAISKYRYPPPYENVYSSQFKTSHLAPIHWQSNTCNNTSNSWRYKSYPNFHELQSQMAQSNVNTGIDVNSHLRNVSQSINTSEPVDIPLPENDPPIESSSVIGVNKNGLIKKIHVVSRHLTKQNKEQIDNLDKRGSMSDHESQISKTKMVESLENATKKLKRGVTENISTDMNKGSAKEIKRPKLLISEPAAIENSHRQQIEQLTGYSPPILPIPTYEKFMGHVKSAFQKKDCRSKHNVSNSTKDAAGHVKKVFSHKARCNSKREESKKISLDEYKKRTLENNFKHGNNYKKQCKYNNDYERNRPNKSRENVDRFSTESDLGYDSDSTVIL